MKQSINKISAFAVNHFRYWWNRAGATLNRLRKSQHQLTSTTELNRYPELFREAAKNVKPHDHLRVLSFGCSTGEECFTLKKYFPNARIIGVDINAANLRKAKSRNTDPAIEFLLSTPANISSKGKYDAIFCMSVLCRWEDTKDLGNCEKIYPFRKFEDTISMLCNNLMAGGLIVIYNSNFRFEETEASENFETVVTPGIGDSGFVHKFDRNNNRVHDHHVASIFRKL